MVCVGIKKNYLKKRESTMSKIHSVIIFGDSIVYGKWDMDAGGWSNRLKLWAMDTFFESKGEHLIHIQAIGLPGSNSSECLKILAHNISVYTNEGNSGRYVFFALGINDMALHVDSDKRRVPIELFGGNISKFIAEVRSKDCTPVLLTITPVSEDKKGEIQNVLGEVRFNKDIEIYNLAIETIGRENGVQVINVYNLFLKAGIDIVLADEGLHPNTEGHILIYELVRDYLRRELSI